MEVVFSDLHTESGLNSLDEYLFSRTYISGDGLTRDDIKIFPVVKPDATLSNISRWYDTVSSSLFERFLGKAVGVRIASQGAAEEAAPVATEKDASAGDEDDDDLGLFEDETEEDKKVAEARETAVKPSSHKKERGKSSVLLDGKPWNDETDIKKLEEMVRSVEMEGLHWGASKLVAVGYSIKKLSIMMTIIDGLVSVETLIEECLTVKPANEYIQSCDIVAFNKI